jgi:NAD(P)-dependent dehydrogenase (short-subunit alcohol dehydrogenase family)
MTRILTGYGNSTTALEVVDGIDLKGQRAIVTGGASGIGIETARALAQAGAEVTLAVRNVAVGDEVARDLRHSTGNDDVYVAHLDLVDRASVARFVEQWSGPLHLLINNAAVMACPLTHTVEGWELQFATNHLGHFGLTLGLHGALKAAGRARVVNVSSSGHLRCPVDFDDLHFERRAYDPWVGYGQSKTANVLFAVGIAKRWLDDGIVAHALMPGGIMTNLQRYVDQAVLDRWAAAEKAGKLRMKTPAEGAATTLVAAVSPLFADVSGRYLEDGNEAEVVDNDAKASSGVRRWALDPVAAEQLWTTSVALLSRPR